MLNIYAPINNLGYGIHASNIIKSLIENGQEVNLTTIGQIQSDPYFEIYWKEAEKNKEKFNSSNPSVFIFHDEHSMQATGKPLLTFSVFETTKLKTMSLETLNNGPTTGILVTTKKHKDLLSTFIKNKKIHVVNEGVDDCLFNTIPVDKFIETNKFTYITIGKKEKRKNTDIILKTFIDKMKDKNVALISHTFNHFIHNLPDHPFRNLNCWSGINPLKYGFEYKGFNGKAHKFTNNKCDIYFTIPTIPISMMPSLYHSANIGIQISRGEGWDLGLMEMLACGVPSIATDCLGHSEYLEHKDLPTIQSDLYLKSFASEIAIDDIWFKGNQGEWDIVDHDKFESLLNQTWEDQLTYRIKRDDLSDFISKNYSWNNSIKTLIDIINEYK